MPKTAIAVSLKASKLGRSCLLLVFLLLASALLLHPQEAAAYLLLFLVPATGLRWHLDFGRRAPRQLLLEDGHWWLLDARGRLYSLPPPVWRSFVWLAFVLPGRPLGLRTWLLWPDSLTAEERRQLRRLSTNP